jgi:hypothetical protein
MFIDTGKEHDDRFGPVCHPACGCGRFVEIGIRRVTAVLQRT